MLARFLLNVMISAAWAVGTVVLFLLVHAWLV